MAVVKDGGVDVDPGIHTATGVYPSKHEGKPVLTNMKVIIAVDL